VAAAVNEDDRVGVAGTIIRFDMGQRDSVDDFSRRRGSSRVWHTLMFSAHEPVVCHLQGAIPEHG
jgi:hypothetical protein